MNGLNNAEAYCTVCHLNIIHVEKYLTKLHRVCNCNTLSVSEGALSFLKDAMATWLGEMR